MVMLYSCEGWKGRIGKRQPRPARSPWHSPNERRPPREADTWHCRGYREGIETGLTVMRRSDEATKRCSDEAVNRQIEEKDAGRMARDDYDGMIKAAAQRIRAAVAP